MINFYKTILFGIILISQIIIAQKNNISEIQKSTEQLQFTPKKAGIAFRIDDNPTKEDYSQMSQIFDNYNNLYGRSFHFSFALNFGAKNFDTLSYRDKIKAIQSRGHEIMDHTPNHRTNYFLTKFDSISYINQATQKPIDGVHHIKKATDSTYKVCLEFNLPTSNGGVNIGTCTLSGNTLTGNFSTFQYDTDVYVYLQELDTLVFIQYFNSDKTVAYIQDVWEEPIIFPYQENVNFYKMNRSNRLSINGIKVLAQETQKLALEYGISPPTTWIQPGGRHPIITMTELKQALTPLGYKAGASFVDNVVAGVTQAFKVFNEYDPNDEKKFGIQWQDFNEDKTSQTIDAIKTKISDGIAKNTVLIGHNHFYDLGSNGYVSVSEYFTRVDSILSWCNQNNIDINTYAEWADILYEKTPDPYENVFPPLNVNTDNFFDALNPNGVPDGYVQRYGEDHGKLVIDTTSPGNDSLCFSVFAYARIFLIQDLGGVEKGENEFEIWTKGSQDDKIKVLFYIPNTISQDTIEFILPAWTSNWTKYNLLNSLNNNKTLNIPENVSRISIEIKLYYFNDDGDSIKVAGMSLMKKRQSIAANLKVNLEGAFSNGAMNVTQDFRNLIQQSQPYADSPWVYTGSESITTVPENVVDWVLVELRSDSTSNYYVHARKAGLLKNDGTIINSDGTPFTVDVASGNYYVVIYHRNHIPVMSSVPVSFN